MPNPFIAEQFASASKAQVDSLLTLANTTFAGMERMAAFNLNMARSMFEDHAGSARALFAAKDFQDFMTIQATLTQPAADKAALWSQGLYAIGSETREALNKTVEAQLHETTQTLNGALDTLAKQAPPGADVAINASLGAVKSALNSANTAYKTLNTAARKMDDYAAAGFATAAKPKPASKSKKA